MAKWRTRRGADGESAGASGATPRTARERVVADIDALCAGRNLEGVRELSDLAAILIASGHVSAAVGRIAVQRIRTERGFPGVGGYHQLRTLAVQAQAAADLAARPQAPVLRLPARAVASEYRRRLTAQRASFVSGGGYFPSRGRDIRSARREGVYLDPEQRGELFDALTLTPTVRAVPPLPATILGARAWLRDVGLDQIDMLLSGPRRQDAAARHEAPQGPAGSGAGTRARTGRSFAYDVGGTHTPWASADESSPGGRRQARQGGHGGQEVPAAVRTAALPEMYTALLLEAGMLYDRLLLAYHHGGRATDELRLQFNAEEELSQISGDTIHLRRAANALPNAERGGADGFAAETGLGPGFDEAWSEIVDRAGVFRELVELAETQASAAVEDRRAAAPTVGRVVPGFAPRSERGGARPAGDGPGTATRYRIDAAADSLLSSAGQRQVSIDTMKRLRNALRGPEPLGGPGAAEPGDEPRHEPGREPGQEPGQETEPGSGAS